MSSPVPHQRPELPSAEELAALPPDGGPKWNRLVFEKSPYLQQHAANPVNWYPWGGEAFEKARQEDKPVFLSVGYSTCHWCHVMEHESFEDPEVARAMNEAFVCVKVDREERPDVDHVYMTVTQALTGSGGWPMTVIMTPEKKPFFAGTYFPKDSRYGRPGMMDLIEHITTLWHEQREKVLESAARISEEIGKIAGSAGAGGGDESLGTETLDQAFEEFHSRFDPMHGGFGGRPKFPVPHNLSFLLRYHARTGNKDALRMVERTLTAMRLGGVFDQVGYGLHRYSTDEEWLVPHFEKMLYDQALLAIACVEAWQATGNCFYGRMAEEIFAYVLRDMTSPEGGFYSAEDADSEGEEGKFYVWTVEEIRSLLDKEDAEMYIKLYNFREEGNFREEATQRLTGANIPHLKVPLEEVAKELGEEPGELPGRVESIRERLFDVREKRVHPFKDDKILTDWNGLMIAALSKAARAFDHAGYAEAAKKAADFVLERLRTPDGRLLKRYRHGEAGLPAHLEDYAFLAWGLTELYEAVFEWKYLDAALGLAEQMGERFRGPDGKGFFQTAADSEQLVFRGKDAQDGAIPSGNSVACMALLRLGRITGRKDVEDMAHETLSAFSEAVGKFPSVHSQMLSALDFAIGDRTQEIVFAGELDGPEARRMVKRVRSRFAPGSVTVHRPAELPEEAHAKAPALVEKTPPEGGLYVYVCQNFTCDRPVSTEQELTPLL